MASKTISIYKILDIQEEGQTIIVIYDGILKTGNNNPGVSSIEN